MSPNRTAHTTPRRGNPQLAKRDDWVLSALCRTPDGEHAGLFDAIDAPGPVARNERRRVERAKTVCASCPVVAECAEFARATDASGVWGGLYFPVPHMGRSAKRPT